MVEFIDWASKFINFEKMNHPSQCLCSSSMDKTKKYDKGSKSSYPTLASTTPTDPLPTLQEIKTNIFLMLE